MGGITTLHNQLDSDASKFIGSEIQIKNSLPAWIDVASSVKLKFQKYLDFVQQQMEKMQALFDEEKISSLNVSSRVMQAFIEGANEELRSVEQFAATGRLARTIAHEVRNPLTNISLASEQLKEISGRSDEGNLLLDMIGRNVNRINQLVSDLLNSTRFEQLEFSPANIHDVLDEALELAHDRIELNHIKVEKHYEDNICEIMLDKDKIRLAFLNIIVNAIEAMKKDSGVLEIKTSKKGNKCLVEFNDNGTGMDQETLQKLFEPYFTRKIKGNGLGLTNTRNIILNHKGNINVRSDIGNGSSFIVILSLS